MRIAWSGLADIKYYNYIAKYCLPSWTKLPGDKYLVNDSKDFFINNFTVVDWNYSYNRDNSFTKNCKRTKAVNFWRKMQSQIWALKTLKNYDWVVLLDTDIEVFDFNINEFKLIIDGILDNKFIWATGESQLKKLDAGHIVVNMKDSRLDELVYDYENIWESGQIFQLRRYYDGDAIESLFDKYPSYKIKNTDHGGGLHTYSLGTVHYGSKLPKILRSLWEGSSNLLIDDMIEEKRKLTNDPILLESFLKANEKN